MGSPPPVWELRWDTPFQEGCGRQGAPASSGVRGKRLRQGCCLGNVQRDGWLPGTGKLLVEHLPAGPALAFQPGLGIVQAVLPYLGDWDAPSLGCLDAAGCRIPVL